MRISKHKRTTVTDVTSGSGARAPRRAMAPGTEVSDGDPRSLIATVAAASKREERTGALLFVGGTHAIDLAVKSAQTVLRLDRMPSLWSHIALVLDWPDGASPEEITGLEVALDPADNSAQLPERNGATLFRLSRYIDPERYPTLAIGLVRMPDEDEKEEASSRSPKTAAELRQSLLEAATDPIRSVQRFPLWEWLGHWELYVRTGGSNPLTEHRPHPAAAFCEYAYEAAGLDLTPGASAPTTSPELLWSTLLHWSNAMGASVKTNNVRIWLFDRTGTEAKRREARSSLREDYGRWTGSSTSDGPPRRPKETVRKRRGQ